MERHEGTLMARLLHFILSSALAIAMTLPAATICHAVSVKQPSTQDQIETTILHVDKYGVYAPNLVFYWSPEMSKQKIAALTHSADQLRNKRAVITYTSVGGIPNDKRPQLVDLAPAKEGAKPAKEDYGREEQAPAATGRADESKPSPTAAKSGTGLDSPAPHSSSGQPELRPLHEQYGLPDSEQPAADRQKDRQTADERTHQTEGIDAPHAAQGDETASVKDAQGGKVASASSSIGKEEVVSLVRRILALTTQKDLKAMLSYYAERVDYYDRGMVDVEYIRKDLGYYFRNWDTISSRLDGDVVVIVTDQHDTRIVKFVSTFFVRNARKSISGKTENIWKIQRINNQLKIVDEKQRTLTAEPKS